MEHGNNIYEHGAGISKFPEYYSVKTIMRRKVYEGNSHTISAIIKKQTDYTHRDLTWLPAIKNHEKTFIEGELFAAGAEVEGDKKQQQPLRDPQLTFLWNCYFPNSGNLTLVLVFRAVSPQDSQYIAHFEYPVKVVKLDHLTSLNVWLLGSLAAGVTFIIGLLKSFGFGQ
jgi:hypothetical protein